MAIDATSVFTAHLARNRGPVAGDPDARQPPDYGVSAVLDGSVIELVLTFRTGAAYCCYEWGCHSGLHKGKRWERLRRELADEGFTVPAQMELRLTASSNPARCSSISRGQSLLAGVVDGMPSRRWRPRSTTWSWWRGPPRDGECADVKAPRWGWRRCDGVGPRPALRFGLGYSRSALRA